MKDKDRPEAAPEEVRLALRREALKARNQWRYARSTSRRLENDQLAWNNLARWQGNLHYRFWDKKLEAEAAAKNATYKEVTPELEEVLSAALGSMNPEIAWQ